ncbi:hypothetical protein GNX71_20845 [Variovorax sp. RKNM96]|uniref:hypothetical protein n=1 Tax=Variovorax sp. RKNM96 TaxID=2681552 RepID=UPI001980246A|nr:hypothetical protein [Variovorax sp. RKNM96]QSI31896.1 hypothetical protein GNX71_20845 [Variovorax sp. RKNM96]
MDTTSPPLDERLVTFTYRGWMFQCRAERIDDLTYRPVVRCLGHSDNPEDIELPDDTDNASYGTEVEALRHAEQQAVRWVHDRTSDGQGQM